MMVLERIMTWLSCNKRVYLKLMANSIMFIYKRKGACCGTKTSKNGHNRYVYET